MAKKLYFPQSQLTTNLYTKGGEFLNSITGKNYKGYYFKTSKNEFYSGKTPQDPPITRLILSSTTSEIDEEFNPQGLIQPQNKSYWVVGNPNYRFGQNINPSLPLTTFPIPSEQDYQTGEFERYFLSKINETKFVETNQFEYLKYLNSDPDVSYQLYTPIKLSWVLTGKREQVYEVNLKTVERTQLNFKLKGFTQYFKGRFTQFYREVGAA